MNNSMISSMVALNSIQKRLDLLADNVANVNTVGYKRKEASFEDTLTRVQEQAAEMKLPGRSMPSGFNLGFGSRLTPVSLNFVQGTIQDTGVPTDLAIQGNALFAVEAGGQKAWVREGDFQVHPDPADPEQAYLTTSQGYYVLNTDGTPIKVPAGSKLQIDRAGFITAVNGSVTSDAGRIKLDYIQRAEGLDQKDDNLFTITPGANEPDVLESLATMAEADPRLESVSVRQGALEQSNVDLTQEMTDMMQIQRAYQLTARALTSSEAMMNMANHLRG
ncbi:flagellar hook-basal body protein [Paenibacillus caui]|uniref:flagellar hook-basal body protein n=1 Tax=Paenibacillus caui TaxID=2873927 RepID=UPI001CA8D88B|nr:flagellar hook-basal body protein [Paenibacillus caui]